MKNIRHILVPVDFSNTARAALDVAVDLAETYDANIDLLHVIPPPSYVPLERTIFGEGKEKTIDEAMRSSAEKQLDQVVATLPDSIRERVTVHMEMGLPSKTIVRYAEAEKTDLVVMGTRGRTGLDELIIGSVAERVLRRAPCPVLTVRGG